MDPRRSLRSFLLASSVVAVLLAAGCTDTGPGPGGTARDPARAGAVPAPDSAALRPYYTQRPAWRECPESPGFQCTRLTVPLDHARPGGRRITLAVARTRATGPGEKLGSLLVNPGGPGGSAVEYLQMFAGTGYPAPVRARYDMVAVDPRGVAGSEPVTCLSGPEMDTYTQVDQTPDDPAEERRLATAHRSFAEGCAKRSAALLPYVSTVDTARDMDVLRAVLGDERLAYVGASYGTFLGATYAELFPRRAGRLVLDGALDPSLSARRVNQDQTAGFETAFRSFAADCVTRRDCPLGTGSTTEAATRLRGLFTRLDARPLPTGEPRRLGEALATTGVLAAMYDEGAWPQLREALDAALSGDGAPLLALADSYYERSGDGSYSNLMFANAAVNCLDLPPAFTGPAEVERASADFEKVSPVFGRGFAWAAMNCAYWPAPATGTPHRITAEGARPILVVGTTRDPATPYRWARALAGQLASGRLLTYEGDGHTAYGRGSDCVDTAINRYLLEGTVPREGTRCR
ncbi:alpha/beta hydrolase [Streptomyces sp. NPDC000594]|uniref:alpha/beta hydrolase n=1 Tax=Streptomyces sp. NPDC000594 TaxID=3154261 RepID=UPI003320B791